MKLAVQYLRELYKACMAGWDRFWFAPSDPATYSLIRILAGAMMFYTHLVWTIGLDDFFGPNAWLSNAAVNAYYDSPYPWSYLWHTQSTATLYAVHLAGLVVFACLTVGFFSRMASVLSYLIVVAYVNRLPGALFGLDQLNALLAMYLMVGPCGARYSVDRWLAKRRSGRASEVAPSVGATIGIRLIQLHMCVIYFFAGISKLQGPAWWDGSALWGAVGNLEYQSIDMTWLAGWPLAIAAMTHVTVLWELSYPALVWPRLTRPLVLALAVPLHLGIGLFLGMPTFGLIMLVGNLAFVSPWLVRTIVERQAPQQSEPELLPLDVRGGAGTPRQRKSRAGETSAVA
ncbi:MAG: HTTM domain-containing protein [Pirellulales bacterium]|nr:HTTM domain-containing protein [Pirellulales bacterium]